MKKSLRVGLVSSLSAMVVGLVIPAYTLTIDANTQPLTVFAATMEGAESTVETATTATFEMKYGGSVRKQDPTGIRFSTYVNETYYSELENSGKDYHFGTLIMPQVLLGAAELNENTADRMDIEAKVWGVSKVSGYKIYHAVLTNIPTDFFDTVLVARSYVCIDGEYTFTSEQQERSAAQVAASALAAGEKDVNDVLVNYVDQVAESISLDRADKLMQTGDQAILTATAAPSGYDITWESSNDEIVMVKDGVITAVAAGEATVTAKFGRKTATCVVTVKDSVADEYQLADVGAISINEYGALTWDEVATAADSEVVADQYVVTLTPEGGEASELIVSKNTYEPYALAAGTYTATVKAAHTKSWVKGSVNASAEYKFVMTRHADYAAADMTAKFESSENGTYVEYNEETGYATIKNANDYGLIASKTGISLNMARNPIIVMDTVAGNGYTYFKMSYNGSSEGGGNKVYLLKDTELGSYKEDRYIAIRANNTVEQGTLEAEVEDFKIYPGLCKGTDSYLTLRGIYIVSVAEYVAPPVQLEKLAAPANLAINGGMFSADKVTAENTDNITYTVSVSGDGVDQSFENLEKPEVDLTKLALVAGNVYEVAVTANGDGTYYDNSDTVVQKIAYNEAYNVSDFSSYEDGKDYKYKEGDVTGTSFSTNGISYTCPNNGNWTTYLLYLDGRLTSNSVLKVTFGDVTNNPKYISGFWHNSGRNIYFEDHVASNSTLIHSIGFDKDTRNSYMENGRIRYTFGMGGSDGSRTIAIKNITIAEYAFYPYEASITSEALTFDKSNEAAQTVAYNFQNGATLDYVSIDGNKVNDCSNNAENNIVTINAGAMSGLSYGDHTVTVTDTNGYSASVTLTVTNSKAVSFEAGYATWLADENATAYEVEILGTEYKETVTGTSYPIAEKNLATGIYTVQVTSVYADGTNLWGSVKLNVEQLIYKSGKLYSSGYQEGGSDKTEEGASAKYYEDAQVTRVTASGKEYGCVYTDDLYVGNEKVAFGENSYLCFTMGTVTDGYYVRLVRDGHEKWAQEVKQATDSVTLIVSAKNLNVEYNQATYYIKLGSSGKKDGYVDYKSYNVCNITVAE